MSVDPQPQQQPSQQPLPSIPQVQGGAPDIELIGEIVEDVEKAEYRLKRGGPDDVFEGLHDRSHSLTILNETEVAQRKLGLEVERDLLAMGMPRQGSPWTGDLRSELMGDPDDRFEPPDEVALMRNFRIAMDRARQSRKGGKLLELLLKTFNINENRDGRQKKKRPWYKRLFPSPGGRR